MKKITENSRSKKSNTGYKGIFFNKKFGKFEVQVSYKSKVKKARNKFYVGLYDTLKEAIQQREEFIKSLF